MSNVSSRPATFRKVVLPEPEGPVTATNSPALTQNQVAALVDSLIDHTEDVDFVLDPVHVSRERTAGRRLQPVQGQHAVITF